MIQSLFLLDSVLKQLIWESLTDRFFAILLNIPLKTYISVVVLLVEDFVQGTFRKELIIVPFFMEL